MRRALWVVLSIVALGSVSSLLSPVHWQFDLVNHLRPQAVAVSAALAVAVMFLGRRLAIAALTVLAVNAILFAVPLVQALQPASAGGLGTVRIMSANVFTANQDHGRLLELVARERPDILVLSETDRHWITALEPLEDSYPHRLPHPRPDNFGMAVYSRHPFQGGIEPVGALGVPMAVLRFERFALITAHPMPPVTARAHRDNLAYLAALAARAGTMEGPVVIAGDLNTTLWGDAMAPLLDAGLGTLNPDGLAYTWPAGRALLAMQIDHLLGRAVGAARFEVLPDIGSDHFPIVADVVLE